MIKYVINEKSRQIMAFLEDTKYDAVKIVGRELCRTGIPIDYFSNKLLMANKYSGTVTCHGDDTFDVEVGKKLAKEKCLANYHRGLEKRLNKFYFDMAVAMDALNSSKPTKCVKCEHGCDCGCDC